MKLMKIKIGEKEYRLGYPTRNDAIVAEYNGLDITQAGKVVSLSETLFYTGLLARQKDITRDEADKLMEQYISEDGDLKEITNFLMNQYMGFFQAKNGKKKATIVEE